MAIELSTPSFKPREYDGEKIEYLVYGLDDEGNEIECIDGPVDTPNSAAALAGDILKQFPNLYFHVTAVLNDADGKMKDSEVVWSNFPEDEANGADETIEYEKGHKNSRGEDAPWVIRDHKNGKVLASFSKKDDAEAHLERMQHYSKSEEFAFDPFDPEMAMAVRICRANKYDLDEIEEYGSDAYWILQDLYNLQDLETLFNDYVKPTKNKKLIADFKATYLRDDGDESLKKELQKARAKKVESANGADEKLSYEKGHKNSKGEDAPWVIRSHKDNSVLASFPTKKEAENHMRTMKRYSKSEAVNDIAAIQDRCDDKIVQKIIYAFTNKEASGWPYHPTSGGGGRPRTIRVDYKGFWENDYRFEDIGGKGILFSNKEMDAAVAKLNSSAYYIIRSSYNPKYPAYFCSKDVKNLRDDERVVTSIPHYEVPSSETKDEGKFTEIKAAIKAAWSAAEAKWFRLDFQESTERLDVYPIASDNEGVGVNWGVLSGRNTIVQYATDFRTGNSEVEREMPYKDLDELEKIFVGEFKAMDETLEIGADNGADIHPIKESRPTESEGTPPGKARAVSWFALPSKTAERDIEKFVSTLEDAVLDDHTVETTAEPSGLIDVDIYGKLPPDEVSRILQVADQLGIHIADMSVNI